MFFALFRFFTPESNRWIIYISISDEYLIMIWEKLEQTAKREIK